MESALFLLYNAVMPKGEREKSRVAGRTGNALKKWQWRSLMKMREARQAGGQVE